VYSVLGAEEITSFFHYGIEASVGKNKFQERGHQTCCTIDGKHPFEVRLIMGLVPINTNFTGVSDVVKKDDSTVTILGRGGEKIDVPCRVDFLFC
jgi:hypothetical protein